MKKVYYSWENIGIMIDNLVIQIKKEGKEYLKDLK